MIHHLSRLILAFLLIGAFAFSGCSKIETNPIVTDDGDILDAAGRLKLESLHQQTQDLEIQAFQVSAAEEELNNAKLDPEYGTYNVPLHGTFLATLLTGGGLPIAYLRHMQVTRSIVKEVKKILLTTGIDQNTTHKALDVLLQQVGVGDASLRKEIIEQSGRASIKPTARTFRRALKNSQPYKAATKASQRSALKVISFTNKFKDIHELLLQRNLEQVLTFHQSLWEKLKAQYGKNTSKAMKTLAKLNPGPSTAKSGRAMARFISANQLDKSEAAALKNILAEQQGLWRAELGANARLEAQAMAAYAFRERPSNLRFGFLRNGKPLSRGLFITASGVILYLIYNEYADNTLDKEQAVLTKESFESLQATLADRRREYTQALETMRANVEDIEAAYGHSLEVLLEFYSPEDKEQMRLFAQEAKKGYDEGWGQWIKERSVDALSTEIGFAVGAKNIVEAVTDYSKEKANNAVEGTKNFWDWSTSPEDNPEDLGAPEVEPGYPNYDDNDYEDMKHEHVLPYP